MKASRRALPSALLSGEQIQTSAVLELAPSPRLVASAREFVKDSVPALPADTVDVLLLLTSELVTNAVIHARTPLEVGVALTEKHVLVTVHDQDLRRPTQQPYADREGGWGLALVTAFAEEHAVEAHPEGGKTSWFRLARGGSPRIADDAAARPHRPVEADG